MNIMLTALGKGFLFGFTMAAVPGPIFFLVIHRALQHGGLIGFMSSMGAVTADTVYGLVSAIGLVLVSDFLLAYQKIIGTLGGFFLIYLGVSTYLRQPQDRSKNERQMSVFSAWFSTFLLTMTNPVTIISYTVIFASLGIGGADQSYVSALLFVLGIIVSALLFEGMLIGGLLYFRQKMAEQFFRWISIISAVVLSGFGVGAIIRSFI